MGEFGGHDTEKLTMSPEDAFATSYGRDPGVEGEPEQEVTVKTGGTE
jgi:hypothetical protein